MRLSKEEQRSFLDQFMTGFAQSCTNTWMKWQTDIEEGLQSQKDVLDHGDMLSYISQGEK